MQRKLRVGIIGTGLIAGAHARFYNEMDETELVSASDISPENLDRFSRNFSVREKFADYREMLTSCSLDAVSVCTPNRHHAEASIGALRCGCHVLCEKPLATSLTEARAMVEASLEENRFLVEGFQCRFSAQSLAARKMWESGAFGRITRIQAIAMRKREIPNWGDFGLEGGCLTDFGIHALEAAHFMAGSPQPTAVAAQIWTTHADRPCNVECRWPGWKYDTFVTEDRAAAWISFANGSVLTLDASFAAHIRRSEWNIVIEGSEAGVDWGRGEMYLDDAGRMISRHLPQSDEESDIPAERYGDYMFQKKMEHFRDVCLGRRGSLITLDEMLVLQQITDACYQSAACEHPIPLKPSDTNISRKALV